MRGMFTLFGFLVVLALVVGYFRGWYQITAQTAENGHNKYAIDVNTQKAKEDISKGAKATVNAIKPKPDNTVQNPPANTPPQVQPPPSH